MNHKMDADAVTGHMGVIKKPRGRLTAYAFFVKDCREKQVHQGIFRSSGFAQKCARQWNMLPDIQKEQFYAMAQQDKERYTQEYSQYVAEKQNNQPSKGAKTMRRKKQKRVKDPNEPKRALTAFLYFCFDERKTVKALNPNLSFGDISKMLGRMWSEVDNMVREKYEQMAERDKLRYEQEMAEYAKTCVIVKEEAGPSGLNLPQEQDVNPSQVETMQIGDFNFTALYPQMELQELPEYTITYLNAEEIIPSDQAVTTIATLHEQSPPYADMYECVGYVEEGNDHDAPGDVGAM